MIEFLTLSQFLRPGADADQQQRPRVCFAPRADELQQPRASPGEGILGAAGGEVVVREGVVGGAVGGVAVLTHHLEILRDVQKRMEID